MSIRILLTGGSGFVGRQILKALQERRIKTRLVLRTTSTIPPAVDRGLLDKVILTSDLFAEDVDWWSRACEDIDTVIHAAWFAEPGKYLQSDKNLECLEGTLRLARGAANANVRRLVGLGTCLEYAPTDSPLFPDSPLKPASPYAAAKAATFMALEQSLPLHGIEFCWCRLFYLYGEGEDNRRLVPYLHTRLSTGQPAELGSGELIRDFIDVCAAGRLITDAALGNQRGAINICSGDPVSIREVAERIADQYGRRDLLRFGARPVITGEPRYIVGARGQAQPLTVQPDE